jgi:uncharacterized delta-60 repeat protein
MKSPITLLACWLLSNAGLTFAQPGTLDPTFSANGKVITHVGTGGDDQIRAIAVQADSKIIAVGNSSETDGGFHVHIAIVRYNTDGRVDKSFGDQSKVVTSIPLDQSFAADVKIQPNGKILVLGTSLAVNSKYDFILLRYNSNGTPDDNFGTNGVVFTDFENSNDYAGAMAIQEDGKIIVAGTIGGGQTTKRYGLVRYNRNGTLDATFGDGGKVATRVNNNNDLFASSVAVLPNGKIVVAGRVTGDNGSYDFALVRYRANGTVDHTFGTQGRVFTDVANSEDFLSFMAVQTDGKILVCGTIRPDASRFQIALARYNENGSLDNSFNRDGKVITVVDPTANNDEAGAMTLQPDGKIIVVGISHGNFVGIRYTTNGSKDRSFGTDGITSTAFNNYSSYATSVALQSNNKVIAAGYAFTDEVIAFALAKYENDNSFASTSTQSDIAINKFQIKIYPNPVTDYIRIAGLDITAPATISIIDNTGKSITKNK